MSEENNAHVVEKVSTLDIIHKWTLPVVGVLFAIMWGTISSLQDKVSDLEKTAVNRSDLAGELQQMERRIKEYTDSRYVDMNSKLEILIRKVVYEDNGYKNKS